MNLTMLNDQRLKAYKTSLYQERGRYGSVCECCDELQIHMQDEYDDVTRRIKDVSIEQMRRKSLTS